MDGHSGFHRRFLNKRQGLGGVLGGILGGGPSPSSVSPGAMTPVVSQTASPLDLGGVLGGLTSLVGAAPSLLLPLGPSSSTTSSTSLTHSSSSTGSTTTSTTSKATSISSTTTSSTTTSSTPTSTPTPTPTSTGSDVVYASTQGPSIVYITSTPVASPTSGAVAKSFLQNPSEEGPVFALVGIVALILIFVVATWTMRKRRRDRLEKDLAAAVTFDPTVTDRYEEDREGSIEKHRLSGSSSGHGHGGFGYGVQPAYAAPQQGYYGPSGYGQYAVPAAYRTPSPNPVPYQGPSPALPQPAAQGGANLQRKFSDRKPVPPLLPNPTYDPSVTQVSLPSDFYQHQNPKESVPL